MGLHFDCKNVSIEKKVAFKVFNVISSPAYVSWPLEFAAACELISEPG